MITLSTVTHPEGRTRTVTLCQFENLAIGQIVGENEAPRLHYAFRTLPDSNAENAKLDALLKKDYHYKEVSSEIIPHDPGAGFNELSFCIGEALDADGEQNTIYSFSNVTVIATDYGLQVYADMPLLSALDMIQMNSDAVSWRRQVEIPNDEATALAFRVHDLCYFLADYDRAPGEEFDEDNHEQRLHGVAEMREQLIENGIRQTLESLKIDLDESREFVSSGIDSEDDYWRGRALERLDRLKEVEALITECSSYAARDADYGVWPDNTFADEDEDEFEP